MFDKTNGARGFLGIFVKNIEILTFSGLGLAT